MAWTVDSSDVTADSSDFTADGGGGAPVVTTLRVRAVAPGDCGGLYRDIGDVFDIISTDFSDSTVSQVPVGNPDYPLYGWMLQVPSNTPLFSWASQGISSPVFGVYGMNAAGVKNLSIPRYVA